MSIQIGTKNTKIADLQRLADFANGLLEQGVHPGTPVSVNAEFNEFTGGEIYARTNLLDGNEDEQIIDFATADDLEEDDDEEE